MHFLAAEIPNGLDLPNFPAIAGLYSQLAGVLAGFAFASLIALIVAQITEKAEAPRSLLSYNPLIAAFISLVATSLNYAVIGGDQVGTGRETALETTAGIGFCVAGTMLMYSIFVLIRGVQSDVERGRDVTTRTANILRIVIVFGVSPLLTALLYGATRDSIVLQKNSNTAVIWVDFAAVALFVVNLAVGVGMFVTFRKSPKVMPKLVSVLSASAVVIALASVLATTLMLSFMDRQAFQPMVVPVAEMVIMDIFSAAVSYSVIRYDA